MKKIKINTSRIILISILAITLLSLLYFFLNQTKSLTFSDSAKIAQAAKNLSLGGSSSTSHRFFTSNLLTNFTPNERPSVNVPPLTAFVLSLIFRVFPATDQTIATFGFLLFLISGSLVFILTKKLSNTEAALIATIFFLINLHLYEYFTNFSNETLLVFELILIPLFFTIRSPLKYLSIIPLLFTLATRQQAILIIFSALFVVVLEYTINPKNKYRYWLPIFLMALGLIFWQFIKSHPNLPFSPMKFLGAINIDSSISQGNYLRGISYTRLSTKQLFVKAFYNIYNFLKQPDKLLHTNILLFFLYNIFSKQKTKTHRQLNFFTVLTFLLFILAASLTLPNARYVHPIVPLVAVLGGIGADRLLKTKKIYFGFIILVLLLTIVPYVGKMTLDQRFKNKNFNFDKPSIRQQISREMSTHIKPGQLTITNLDAWAAWYYDLDTMWFPVHPNQLKISEGGVNKVEYLVITNYLENDGDFVLNDWSEVVYSPDNITNDYLNQNYQVYKTFMIQPEQVYENIPIKGTILKSNNY